MRKPLTRWTADTETAFLLALRRTGAVQAAVAMIGREKGAAYRRRQGHPDFAKRWDAVLAECRAELAARETAQGEGEARERHARYDGLSAVRKRAFLRAVAETGQLQKACERIGVSAQTVALLRKRSPEFDEACENALRISLPSIAQIAYERAVDGWDEDVVVRGEVVGTRRRYSERLLSDLLKAELAARHAERVEDVKQGRNRPPPPKPGETMKVLLDRLSKIEQARKRAKQMADRAAAERWEQVVRSGELPPPRPRDAD